MTQMLSNPVAELEPSDEGAFDLWLRGELTRMYDSALQEPVPETLLGLLRGAVQQAEDAAQG